MKDQSHNIRKMMWFCGLYGLASSIAMMGLFDAYLYMLSGSSNSSVGIAESVSGITQILAVLPAGYLADRVSRSLILTYCGWFSILYVTLACVGIYLDSMLFIYSALVAGGFYAAVQNTASFALFSDSIPQGDRALWMSRVAVLTQVAMGVGPALSILMIYILGDEWDLKILHLVLIGGYSLLIPANFFLTGWQDIPPESSPVISSADHPLLDHSGTTTRKRKFSLVPYMICLNDLITCVGAGMTVKFFPLFFKNDYGLSPIQLQMLYCIYCLVFAVFTWLCEKVAARIGRVQSSLIFALSGVGCLFSLAYLQSLPAVVLVFILRGALQNSIYPIDRSIIMDFVPSDQRGRWNSIESISAMTWSGSAVLGGYLMDSHDYRYTFVITAWIYLFAVVLRIPMLWMVPKKEKFVQAKIHSANEQIMKSPIASSPLVFSQ